LEYLESKLTAKEQKNNSIIASCIPTLKQFFEGLLRRAGILTRTPLPPRLRSLPYIPQDHDGAEGTDNVLSTLGSSKDREKEPQVSRPAAAESVESQLPIMGVRVAVQEDRRRDKR